VWCIDSAVVVLLLQVLVMVLAVHVQYLLERSPEVHVAPGVYDRVDSRVQVTEPRYHVDEHLGRWTARFAERKEQVDDEERQPADHKHSHDDAQRLGRLPFLGQRYALLVLQQLVDVLAHGRRRPHRHRRTPPRPLLVAAGASTVCGRVHLVAAAGRVSSGRVHRHLGVATATVGVHVLPFARRTGRRRQRRAHRRPLWPAVLRHGYLLGPAPQSSPGGHVYSEIRDAHHHQRYVKRSHGRVHHVTGVRGERARRALVEHVRPVVPADERRRADDRAGDPHQRHRPHDTGNGSLLRVRYRLRDGPVPVQRDGAQVQYGRGAAQHVARQPQLAHDAAEQPNARHVVHDVQRQHADGHGQVGHGQRHDEYVWHGPERRVLHHAHDDQYVAEHGDHDQRRGHRDHRDHRHHGGRTGHGSVVAGRTAAVYGRSGHLDRRCRRRFVDHLFVTPPPPLLIL